MLETNYSERKNIFYAPRIPLRGDFFLTYRCNNNCRHCWNRVANCEKISQSELSLEQIKTIVNQARKNGAREWSLSGGEPLLRGDFLDIFMYIKENSAACSLNTNGTLITRKIAPFLCGPGVKAISLYGATAKTHDYITRRPGSFEETIRGARYLKEAKVSSIMQIILLKDNQDEFKNMVSLAKSLSRGYRYGNAWLYLSACGNPEVNRQIVSQRIAPELSAPIDAFDEVCFRNKNQIGNRKRNSFYFSDCTRGSSFFINPYGELSFCCLIQRKDMFFNLKRGSFMEGWEKFIPSLSKKIKVTQEYLKNCGSCDLGIYCRWCPAYAFLEHRRFGTKINYLCAVARKTAKLKEENHSKSKLFELAGMKIFLESDISFPSDYLSKTINLFAKDSFGIRKPDISIKHHFGLPQINFSSLGKLVYKKTPWEIYKREDAWVYLLVGNYSNRKRINKVVVLNKNYTRARVYHKSPMVLMHKGVSSVYGLITDQIFLSKIAVAFKGFYLHACGISYKNDGFVFVGHSGVGKSTIAKMFEGKAKVLCDDRVIIRESRGSLKLYGTWSHGEVETVNPGGVPLKGVFFLKQAKTNSFFRLTDKKSIIFKLCGCLIKPLITVDWWEKVLNLIEKSASQSNFFMLSFNKKVDLVTVLEKIKGGKYG